MLYDFIKLHRWVMEIPYMDLTECVVLCVLLNAKNVYGDKNGEFFLKYEEIAEMSKLSLSQTKRVIKKLEGYNLITTVRRKRMHYRLEWDRLNTYMQEEEFKQPAKKVEQPIVKPIEEKIEMKEIEIDDYKQIEEDNQVELPTPDDDRLEFNCWVIDKAKDKLPRWMGLVKYKKDLVAITEIGKFANILSTEYYNGAFQPQMREVLGRRIRNAS